MWAYWELEVLAMRPPLSLSWSIQSATDRTAVYFIVFSCLVLVGFIVLCWSLALLMCASIPPCSCRCFWLSFIFCLYAFISLAIYRRRKATVISSIIFCLFDCFYSFPEPVNIVPPLLSSPFVLNNFLFLLFRFRQSEGDLKKLKQQDQSMEEGKSLFILWFLSCFLSSLFFSR